MKKSFSIFKKLGFLTALLAGLQNSQAQTYCTPTYDFQFSCPYDYGRIQSFSVSGINGSELFDYTPCGDYTDLTATIPVLQMAAGRSYSGSIGMNSSNASYGIWIDYNNDGTFSDAERISFANAPNFTYAVTSSNGSSALYKHLFGITIQIPANAPVGQHRLRVRSSYMFTSTYPAETPACARRYAGASADYLVNITAPNSCAPIFTTQPVSQNVCGNGDVSFTAATDIQASFQWQVNYGSGFTNITNNSMYSGATTGTLVITGATNTISGYQYRCLATSGSCSACSQYAIYWQKQPLASSVLTDKIVNTSGNTEYSIVALTSTGSPATVQWQVDKGNGFNNIGTDIHYFVFNSGNLSTLSIYDIPTSFNNYKYRAAMSNSTCTSYSNASTITVQPIPMPEFYYTKNAIANNTIPLGSANPYRTQLLYLPGDFGSNAKSGVISKVYFKSGTTTTLPTTFSNFKIDIGNTSTTSLTSYISGLTNVLNAPSFTIPAVSADNWIGIELATPIYIDVTQPLVIEISTTSKTGTGFSLKAGGSPVSSTYTGNTQVYNVMGSSTVSSRRYTYQFGFDMQCDINITSQPSNITVNADANQCSASNVSLGTVTATSACGTVSVSNDAPSVFSKGTSTVTWIVTDGYVTKNVTQTVTVVDNQAPVITCPSNITVTATTGNCSATVDYTIPTATDNCGTCSAPSSIPGYTLMGTYGGHSYFKSNFGNSWEYFDSAAKAMGGHLATVSNASENNFLNASPGGVWIGLTDKANEGTWVWSNGEPVTFTFWANNEPNNLGDEDYAMITWQSNGDWNDGDGSATNWNLPAIIEFDCDQNTLPLNLTRTAGPASGSTFPVGTTTVTYTATDGSSNTSSCSFTVTVLPSPNNNVSISVTPSNNTYTGGVPTTIYLGYGPQSATLGANATGGSGFNYSWSPATGLSCTNCQNPVFTPTTAGNYTYTVTATNSNGCSVAKSVTLCVLDVRAPNGNDKVYLCHNGNTISISSNAVQAHLNNHSGDKLGSCSQECGSANKGGAETVSTFVSDEIKVYPSPNNGNFIVELPNAVDNAEINIMDMTGKLIERKAISGSKAQFSLSIAKGVYMVVVKTADRMNYSRVVIQ